MPGLVSALHLLVALEKPSDPGYHIAAFWESSGLRSLLRLAIGDAAMLTMKLAASAPLNMEKGDIGYKLKCYGATDSTKKKMEFRPL